MVQVVSEPRYNWIMMNEANLVNSCNAIAKSLTRTVADDQRLPIDGCDGSNNVVREPAGSSFTMVKYIDEKVGSRRVAMGKIVYKVTITATYEPA